MLVFVSTDIIMSGAASGVDYYNKKRTNAYDAGGSGGASFGAENKCTILS
jgi:hypothetical protein